MQTRKAFVSRVGRTLAMIDPAKLLYSENEFWLIQSAYEYLECYAVDRRFLNTSIALPLARSLHNGVYRKFSIRKGGTQYRVPYYIHCLMVCRMLVDIHPALPPEDEDCLLAAALCHDLLEDIPFDEGGQELVTRFHLSPRVLEIVRLLTKKPNAALEEEQQYFAAIMANPLALLVKLADRGNNVEDLYNMSQKKFGEYLEETEAYFLPMSDYGISAYPELAIPIHILRDKISILTTTAKVMTARLEARNQLLRDERNQLKLDNRKLREEWSRLWKEEMADEGRN